MRNSRRHKGKGHGWLIFFIIVAIAIGAYFLFSGEGNTTETKPGPKSSEIRLGRAVLALPENDSEAAAKWFFNDPNVKSYFRVVVTPTVNTVPNQVYTVALLYRNEEVGRGNTSWSVQDLSQKAWSSNAPVLPAKSFQFPILKSHELYEQYVANFAKPISERVNVRNVVAQTTSVILVK